ncbi:MAG: hypothetical protein ACREBF_02880 [Candidatus Micrarchaeales archaeon]
MGIIQKWVSASYAGELENMLDTGGVEGSTTCEELALAIRANKSQLLVERLHDYANKVPQSREMIVGAFDAYVADCRSAKLARKVRRSISEILALTMLEAISE